MVSMLLLVLGSEVLGVEINFSIAPPGRLFGATGLLTLGFLCCPNLIRLESLYIKLLTYNLFQLFDLLCLVLN